MRCFLTSSPITPGATDLNAQNGFAKDLRDALPSPCRVLFICSSPDAPHMTDRFSGDMQASMAESSFLISRWDILDPRTDRDADGLIAAADLLILAGGHVPTQQRYFQQIRLRDRLKGYSGVVMGISAGTMNAAETVYVQPEDPGESAPDFPRFLPGLGLCQTQIVPHYQQTKDWLLDGRRLFEDITYADSLGHCFYLLVDGSYLYVKDGMEVLHGEACRLQDGVLTPCCQAGESLRLR